MPGADALYCTPPASWQSAHFISVNGNTMAIAFGNESNDRGRVIGKERKDYIDFYGRSWR